LAQENGREEADNANGVNESEASRNGSSDLPEHLRTEPIPLIDPPAPGPASSLDSAAEAGADAAAEQSSAAPEQETAAPEAAGETEAIQRVSVNDRALSETPPEPGPESAPAPAPEPFPHDSRPAEGAQEVKNSKGKKTGIIIAASVLVLALAYVGIAWFFADRVPADTTVAGVDVSGLTRSDAVDRLATELDDVITSEITVTLGESESAIDPESSGLDFDIDATVDQLVGFSLDPASVFGHLFGRGDHEPVINTDTSALRQSLTTIASDLDDPPVEGEIAIVDGEVEITEPEDGVSIDVDEALPLIVDDWLQGPRPIALPEVTVAPTIDAEKIEQTQKNLVDPLLSAGVALSINDEETEIPVEVIADAASLHLVETTYEVRLDPETVADAVAELLPELGESPKPAKFEFKDGKPHIVPSVTGAGINPEELADVVAEAAVKTGDERHAEMELETTEPDFTTEDAKELGVKERVSSYSTPVPYDPVRTKNLVTGAKNLNGMLIKPGETFSLIEAFGPIDAAHGYVASGVVVNGFTSEAMGGGLSQVSTTMFNAAFEAGMEDVTHTPHSRYFSRYPEGREATLYLPNLDMKWRNNTPYGVLIRAWIDDEAHVELWSTKYWDTKITTGPRTNITAPKTVYNSAPDCVPERGGASGFTVTVQRIVSKDGVRNDEFSRSYSHTYQPWNNVVCGTKPKEKSKDEDSAKSSKSSDSGDSDD